MVKSWGKGITKTPFSGKIMIKMNTEEQEHHVENPSEFSGKTMKMHKIPQIDQQIALSLRGQDTNSQGSFADMNENQVLKQRSKSCFFSMNNNVQRIYDQYSILQTFNNMLHIFEIQHFKENKTTKQSGVYQEQVFLS